MATHTSAQFELSVSTEPSVESISFLDVKAQFAEICHEIGKAVNSVLESQHFILGPEVEALEREIAEYVGVLTTKMSLPQPRVLSELHPQRESSRRTADSSASIPLEPC